MSAIRALIRRHDVTLFTVEEAPRHGGPPKSTERVVEMDDGEVQRAAEAMRAYARVQRHLALDYGHVAPPLSSGVPFPGPETAERDMFAREHGRNTLLNGAATALRAVGASPEIAIRHWCESQNMQFERLGAPLDNSDTEFTWGYRFTADGTGFKGPGGRCRGAWC